MKLNGIASLTERSIEDINIPIKARNGNGNGSSHGLAANGYVTNGDGHNTTAAAVVDRPLGDQAGAQAAYDPAFEALIEKILMRIGENPARDGLLRTPLRVAKALDDLTSGYRTDLATVVNDAVFEDDGEEMVIVKDIEFYSLCEHHMLPFFGRVHIAYIPDGKIIGLSKLARITDVFARRLQVQERLTNQIADALTELLQPRGVAVMAEAAHFCMMMRGVQKQNSSTITTAMRGVFKQDLDLRREFTQTVRGK
jgi:GTP cyclohydrolase IA